MAITFSCACGKAVQVGDEFAGLEGQCPSCGRTVRIPGPDGLITPQAPPLPWAARRSAAPPPLPAEESAAEDEADVAQLVTHAGTPIAQDDDFFAEAPAQLGRLVSAFTTLKTHQEPRSAALRAILAGILFLAGFLVTAFLIAVIKQGGGWHAGDLCLLCVVPGAVGAVLTGSALWMTRFSHVCSYVGAEGITAYRCSGGRDRVTRTHFFLFENAVDLRIGQTRHYYNGVYTGTNYVYTWSDENGRTVFTLAGRYRSEPGTPVPADPFYLAQGAEMAWSIYLFRNIDRVMTSDELLFFGLKGGDYLQLGPGLLVLAQGGKTIELNSDQIEKMTIGNGAISVWELGAKEGWFVNKGIHQFLYQDLGNARFFMFALEKFLGIQL